MSGQVSFVSSDQSIVEGTGTDTLVRFTIVRSNGSAGAASVDWQVASRGGVATGDDFAGGVIPSGTVTWADGESGAKEISFYIAGDSRPEDFEAFQVNLSNPVNVTRAIEPGLARFGIENDDFQTQTIQFAGGITRAEGADGTTSYSFTVTRSGGTSGSVGLTVDFSAGTTDAADFVGGLPSRQNLTFLEGQSSLDVTVQVRGDTVVESDEQFSLAIASVYRLTAPGVTVAKGATASVTGVILNDDVAGGGSFAISAVNPTVAEGNGGTTPVSFTITRSGAGGGTATVNYALALTGTADAADFNGATSGTVAFNGNETKTVTILVAGDFAVEGNETFALVLSNPTDGATIATGSATATIANDDGAGALSVANASVTEGDVGTVTGAFVVTRAGGTSGTVTATYQITLPAGSGGASAADVSSPLSGQVTFLEGETSKLILFDVIGDDLIEGDETFSVTLDNPTGGAIIANGSAIATIRDDEETLGTSNSETLTGTSGNDYLGGLGGDDILRGLVGNDVLNGGTGTDLMEGGAGNDTYLVDAASDRAVEAAGEGYDTVFALASYALAAGSEIEELSAQVASSTTRLDLTGNEIANRLYGSAGVNVLNGGGGADILTGLGGDDIYLVDTPADQVIEAVGGGYDTVFTLSSYTLAAGQEIEELVANAPAATTRIDLTGNAFANRLYGNAGVNVLNGGAGADILVGLGGDDIYLVDNVADQVFEVAGGGYDIVFALSSFVLGAGSAVEELAANVAAGTARLDLTGNELANRLTGNAGVNVLNGGAGADILVGLGGNDIYLVDNVADQVIEVAGGGYDIVFALGSYVLAAGADVEELAVNDPGSTARLDLAGNERGNALYGNAGTNVLYGRDGSDTLTGGAGADIFVFDTTLAAGGIDRITDFTVGVDKIALDDSMFQGLASLPPSAFFNGQGPYTAAHRIAYNPETGALFFDPDGSFAGLATQFATIGTGLNLTAADFVII